jgi:chaperonin GroEL (HSP60 family)
MTLKQLSFSSAAREKVLRGATALADAVRVTLGPKSKSVLIGKKWGNPIVCNDGVTIAKEIELADPEEDLGARMMRQVAEKTGDAVGDGTTTATILAHAASEAELKSRKEAFDDAISATRAAVAEGVVPGAGLALLRAIDAVRAEEEHCDGDERTGLKILARALEAPTRQIATNSGIDDGVVVEKMRAGSGAYGLDAATGVYVDLTAVGIIDPTKVVRMALEHAVSVAGVLLLTEATLTEAPEPEPRTHERMGESFA